MNGRSRVVPLAIALLLVGLGLSVVCQRRAASVRGNESTLQEVLYVPSGKTLRKLSLGYSSLLADVYWTRAVQYFGARHIRHSTNYDLLYPLLDITTDLDSNLLVAYDAGSIFLSQEQPEGAGQPDHAVNLLEKGIRANPEHWRFYFTLGFIHYVDRHDYKAAQQAFEKGSEVPGALPWMKVMAATMAQKADEPRVAYELWRRLLETTQDKEVQKNARKHLAALQADQDVMDLEHLADAYKSRTGKYPSAWQDLIRFGWLRGIPRDPADNPYKLTAAGTVEVADPSKLPFIVNGLPGHKKLSSQPSPK